MGRGRLLVGRCVCELMEALRRMGISDRGMETRAAVCGAGMTEYALEQ